MISFIHSEAQNCIFSDVSLFWTNSILFYIFDDRDRANIPKFSFCDLSLPFGEHPCIVKERQWSKKLKDFNENLIHLFGVEAWKSNKGQSMELCTSEQMMLLEGGNIRGGNVCVVINKRIVHSNCNYKMILLLDCCWIY